MKELHLQAPGCGIEINDGVDGLFRVQARMIQHSPPNVYQPARSENRGDSHETAIAILRVTD
ncbi:MAG: hypothetical protein ACKVHE_27490 [Planctomycetales bacterium]